MLELSVSQMFREMKLNIKEEVTVCVVHVVY